MIWFQTAKRLVTSVRHSGAPDDEYDDDDDVFDPGDCDEFDDEM